MCAREQFDFSSSFWINLHHFMLLLAQHELGKVPDRPTVRAAVGDFAAARLSDAELEDWTRALAVYKRDVVDIEPWAAPLTELQADLTHTSAAATPTSEELPDVARALSIAAPTYRRHWWPAHDATNTAWITDVQRFRGMYGDSVSRRMTDAFHTCWPEQPIHVQVVAHVTFYGAFQQDEPLMLNLSSTYDAHAGSGGFEQLYHEAGHLLDQYVFEALQTEVRRRNITTRRGAVRDLAHAILFHTAGEAVRLSMPDHPTYAETWGVWERSTATKRLLDEHWLPYLHGEIDFATAIARIAAGMAEK